MSFLYGLDGVEQNKLADIANTHGADLSAVTPGATDGLAEAAFTGLFSGVVAKPAVLLGDMATNKLLPLADQIDKRFDTNTREWLEAEQQKNVDMLKTLRERQAGYGTVAQLVNGFADVVPQAIAGAAVAGPAGSAAAVGTLQGYADYRLGREDGLDAGTAAAKGAITGVANAVGVALPMAKAGAGLLGNLAFGATTNVAAGMAQRGATGALLEARGYTDMAQQYQWLDKEAIALDAVLGAAFGGVGHYMHGKLAPKAADVDAALVLNERQHIEIDTAPGVPITPEARDAHVEAHMKAVEQLMQGKPVDVAEVAQRVEAVENPRVTEMRAEQAALVRNELPKEIVDPLPLRDETGTPREPALREETRSAVSAEGKDAAAVKPGKTEPTPKVHDGTPESMARAADILPSEREMVRQIVDVKPELMIAREDGSLARAADMLREADIEIETATRDSALHDVAVACFLRG